MFQRIQQRNILHLLFHPPHTLLGTTSKVTAMMMRMMMMMMRVMKVFPPDILPRHSRPKAGLGVVMMMMMMLSHTYSQAGIQNDTIISTERIVIISILIIFLISILMTSY